MKLSNQEKMRSRKTVTYINRIMADVEAPLLVWQNGCASKKFWYSFHENVSTYGDLENILMK